MTEYKSTLERGDEIEQDFYILKAQEWACEFAEAKIAIELALSSIKGFFIERRK